MAKDTLTVLDVRTGRRVTATVSPETLALWRKLQSPLEGKGGGANPAFNDAATRYLEARGYETVGRPPTSHILAYVVTHLCREVGAEASTGAYSYDDGIRAVLTDAEATRGVWASDRFPSLALKTGLTTGDAVELAPALAASEPALPLTERAPRTRSAPKSGAPKTARKPR